MLTKAYVRFRNCFAREEGATAVEYGLMVAGIAMLIVLAVFALGGNLAALYNTVATKTASWLGP